MALLELATQRSIGCSELVLCVDRSMNPSDLTVLTRDLGWVGFELTTLAPWTGKMETTSDRWLMLTMEA
jgi:hypothetical protein